MSASSSSNSTNRRAAHYKSKLKEIVALLQAERADNQQQFEALEQERDELVGFAHRLPCLLCDFL